MDQGNETGWTDLMYASYIEDPTQQGANVSIGPDEGFTALHAST